MTKDQRLWSVVALATFVVLCAMSFALVSRYADLSPADLNFFDLTVLGLATLRLVHLLTYDKIFQIVRDPFMDAKRGRLRKAQHGWRRLMCEFLACIWCTGMWSAVFAVTIYFLGLWGRYAVILFAVAGLGSLLQVISKSIAER